MYKFFMLSIIALSFLVVGCSESADTQKGSSNAAVVVSTDLTFQAPEAWVSQVPSSSMRKAQYSLPGQGHAVAPAELAVFHFPGQGGSVDMNIERWYGQFTQPDGSATKEKSVVENSTVNGLKVTKLYFTGTYALSPMTGAATDSKGENYAALIAVVETAAGPWFFKATGPQATIDANKTEFDNFIQTFKQQ